MCNYTLRFLVVGTLYYRPPYTTTMPKCRHEDNNVVTKYNTLFVEELHCGRSANAVVNCRLDRRELVATGLTFLHLRTSLVDHNGTGGLRHRPNVGRIKRRKRDLLWKQPWLVVWPVLTLPRFIAKAGFQQTTHYLQVTATTDKLQRPL